MLSVSFAVAVLIELAFPFALAAWLTRRLGAQPQLFWVGALTFVVSQLAHLPLLAGLNLLYRAAVLPDNLPFQAALLGLLAGLCEEPARWLGFYWLKKTRLTSASALIMAAGHGGVESFLVGISVLVNFALMFLVREGLLQVAGIDELQILRAWSSPWYLPLAGAFERLIALSLHLALSLMVFRSFMLRSWGWLAAAIAWHALVNFAAVLALQSGFSTWTMEAILFIFAPVNGLIVWWSLRRSLPSGLKLAGARAQLFDANGVIMHNEQPPTPSTEPVAQPPEQDSISER